jgi:hypothetical protein
MTTVWVVNEWGANDPLTIGLGDAVLRLNALAAQTGVNLSVKHATAGMLPTLNVQSVDVVVICQVCPSATSALPGASPGWMTSETAVLPLLKSAADAAQLAPYLKGRNALICDTASKAFSSRLFDEIATLAVQLRPAKKVFVSYQRKATPSAALQLVDELQALGFDTFLDERSILPAADIDAEIGYRLNDVDLVILLVTSQLPSSRWVLKEIEFAHNAKLGILAIDCDSSGTPAAVFKHLHDDEVLTLTHPILDPADSFSSSDLPRILDEVRQERVSGITRRVADLVPAAADQLESRYPGLVRGGERLGSLQVEGVPGLTQVVPFRPTPELLWQFRQKHLGQRVDVIHPESVPLDPRVAALEWLLLPVELEVKVHHVRKLWV